MGNALIGHSGFVGSTLLKQASFEHLFRSTDIANIRGHSFDTVVCAGAPAQKWLANKDPVGDLKSINGLISHLETVACKTFILISTVDVFPNPDGVDEDTEVDEGNSQPYGLHRRYLEKFVQSRFPNTLIVRLPGLVGPGLRKNVIYDYHHDNNVGSVETRNVFQFYPMVNLWFDIQLALARKIPLIHLTAEPVSVSDVYSEGFGRPLQNELGNKVIRYDMRSKFARELGGSSSYQYSRRETLQAVRHFAQSEPRLKK